MPSPQKTVVVGAGPVGSLAALYAAQRGHEVEVYELRPGTCPRPPRSRPVTASRQSLSLRDVGPRGARASTAAAYTRQAASPAVA